MRVFIDTNIPMHAAGGEHPYRDACQTIIRSIANGSVDAVTDAEVFQEILDRYLHIKRREQGFMIFDAFQTVMRDAILPVTMQDVALARELADSYPALSPRDLIHIAVMMHHELTHVVSTDQSLDSVEAVSRIDPADFNEEEL